MGVFSFEPAPIPPGDHERSRVAQASGLLTAAPEPRLTGLTHAAKVALGARWSGLCVIVDDLQHVVASSGGMLGVYRRATALSSYAIAYPDQPFFVLDAAGDERFVGNPFVDNGMMRFFAAAPVWRGNFVVGALCVTDQKPRYDVSSDHLQRLQCLADAVLNPWPTKCDALFPDEGDGGQGTVSSIAVGVA